MISRKRGNWHTNGSNNAGLSNGHGFTNGASSSKKPIRSAPRSFRGSLPLVLGFFFLTDDSVPVRQRPKIPLHSNGTPTEHELSRQERIICQSATRVSKDVSYPAWHQVSPPGVACISIQQLSESWHSRRSKLHYRQRRGPWKIFRAPAVAAI